MGMKYMYVSKETMLKAIQEGKNIKWDELPANFKEDGDIALAAFYAKGDDALKHFEKGHIANKKFILNHPSAEHYDYLTNDLKKDGQVILKVKEYVDHRYSETSTADSTLGYLPPELLKTAEDNYNKFHDIFETQKANMSPYRKVAKAAFMQWPPYLSDEEATKKAMAEDIKSLEDQVGAMSSVKSAVQSLATSLGLSNEEQTLFEDAIINGYADNKIFAAISEKAKTIDNVEELILKGLSDIHDNWVKNNASEKTFEKKASRNQLRQYTPLEIIGWNEAKSDLLFLNPVLSSIGITVNEQALQNAYYEKLEKFLTDKGTNLESLIRSGKAFYPSLPDELEARLTPLAKTVSEQLLDNWETNDEKSMAIFNKNMPEIRVVTYKEVPSKDNEASIDLNNLSMEELEMYEQTGMLPQETPKDNKPHTL